MPEEYQVLYPSHTTEKQVLASVVMEDDISEDERRNIRAALRSAAELSLAASGVMNVVPGARTIQIEAPQGFNEAVGTTVQESIEVSED